MDLQFGALCPKVSHQLRGQKISKDKLKLLNRCADSITFLFVQGLLSDKESHSARKRLVRKIESFTKD